MALQRITNEKYILDSINLPNNRLAYTARSDATGSILYLCICDLSNNPPSSIRTDLSFWGQISFGKRCERLGELEIKSRNHSSSYYVADKCILLAATHLGLKMVLIEYDQHNIIIRNKMHIPNRLYNGAGKFFINWDFQSSHAFSNYTLIAITSQTALAPLSIRSVFNHCK